VNYVIPISFFLLSAFFSLRNAETDRGKVVGILMLGGSSVLFCLYLSGIRGMGVSEWIVKFFEEMGWGM